MKNKLMDIQDKFLLRKRAIIETINDQLKNISQIEYSHRSPANFLINLLLLSKEKTKLENTSKIFSCLLNTKTHVKKLEKHFRIVFSFSQLKQKCYFCVFFINFSGIVVISFISFMNNLF